MLAEGLFSALKSTSLTNNAGNQWLVYTRDSSKKGRVATGSQHVLVSKAEIALVANDEVVYHPDIHEFSGIDQAFCECDI